MRYGNRRRIAPQPPLARAPRPLVLVAMLVLVLIAMVQLRDPRSWGWLSQFDQGPAASAPAIDSVQPQGIPQEPPAAEFTAPFAEPPAPDRPRESQPSEPPPGDDAPQVDLAVFEGMRDKTRALPPKAYFHLLDVARRTDPEELEGQARRDLTFAHFARSPERYRGQPVFLRGHLRRLTEYRPAANAEGFERLYEGWLFTEESQDNPYTIIISRVPEGMPLGGNILEDVSFAGYFLKLWGYRAADSDRYAPLFLGHRVVWHPRPVWSADNWRIQLIMGGLVAGLFALLFAVIWWSRRSTQAAREAYRLLGEPRDTPTTLPSVAPSPEEYLESLAHERDHEPPPADDRDGSEPRPDEGERGT